MNTAQFVLDNAETQPEAVKAKLIELHEKGETVEDILEFVVELQARQIKVPYPGKLTFDVCGTGGSGKSRINLSTALALKLSKNYCIAKHGNKAASGRVGSFDIIETLNLPVGDTPEKVSQQLKNYNLSFVFAPAFHPALKALAPIRKEIPHPTIFNYLGPLLNPVPLAGQMIGVPSLEVGDKLAQVCAHLNKNAALVHDTAFGLDDVSIGGATRFWAVGANKEIRTGAFFPEDYGFKTVTDFAEIAGGSLVENQEIVKQLVAGTATQAQQDFLAINAKVAAEFFDRMRQVV
ncbi:anthranilate phosphoribosyltransferase [bacterium]|nr:anthranilate phosphoribosyltransferase [bacterium]NCQ54889.1 anthranilate phosphoribosyltransferase [Candidatus Parcubacteria bacterium]NCS66933.1 anthranilate phosphoribosyltransferase [Candidatus Peregrinibacteria bacterium]NCS95880.1 anthranilate phosphoribosyltransferase [bacterium]